jgi:hypothetical protein
MTGKNAIQTITDATAATYSPTFAMISQVAETVVAALKPDNNATTADRNIRGTSKDPDDQKFYNKFQLTKLKGLSCIQNDTSLQCI